MKFAIVFLIALPVIGANAAQAQPVRSIQENYTVAVSLNPINGVARLSSRPAPATTLQGNAPPITARAPLRDLKLPRLQECSASPGRIALGATLGLLAGTVIGVVYGAVGHPGLPHIGADVPSELEYTPLFALGGAVVGGIMSARAPRECPTA